ncbi:conserved hypothetical protein [Ricinus communis]|uniref:Secreted protein n=1 Tax=Ricinus communis TaxID=3988 RepID=B9RQB1_RICCO|nr:conserved hypothetical protein [Ricinus communis]
MAAGSSSVSSLLWFRLHVLQFFTREVEQWVEIVWLGRSKAVYHSRSGVGIGGDGMPHNIGGSKIVCPHCVCCKAPATPTACCECCELL